MLTIASGVPGSGKTLWTVNQILNNPEYSSRPVFVHNLEGFDFSIRDNLFPLDDAKLWNDLPEKSVIIFDEAQYAFPVRPANQPPPPWVDNFSTHRHKGYDIIMTSQHPTMIDGHIRKLCGRHLHFLRVFGLKSCTIFEWPEYRTDNVDSSSRRKLALSKRWQYPKKVFGAYKSADAHTHTRKIPWKVWSIPVFFIIAAFALYYLYHDFSTGNFANLGHKPPSVTSHVITSSVPPMPSSAFHPVSSIPSVPNHPVRTLHIYGSISHNDRFYFVVVTKRGDYVLVKRSHCVHHIANWVCDVGGVNASLISSSNSS
ncbi:zonular occludens toxin domain-containing protein [Acidithiobacillus sp. HP-11]|uniref:zonular occludens toxin domain-containing protein n=1 Tax=Acidithiobacillus sp. HP-11 TaxID=2697656 RepID=UPI00187AF6B5|nr:zonular occludens toxin domain-containing protein [Acidithiobacillus sp. HP-11]MBE7567477.1 hypothetical protein [Acidithiobacillus sp. HP-11]